MPSGGGRKDKNMASTSTTQVTISTESRTLPLALAALLGLFIVGFVGV